MLKFDRHTITMILMVGLIILSGQYVLVNLSNLNPFKKGVEDYQFTDIIFSKFNEHEHFDERIVLVNVGKPSRRNIAEAITKLDSAGSKVIGVDVIFEGKKDAQSDSLLRKSVHVAENIVLADHFEFDRNFPPHTCDTTFCNVDNIGFVNFNTRPNYSVRYYAPYFKHKGEKYPSFSSRLVEMSYPAEAQRLRDRGNEVEQIYYRGSQNCYAQMQLDDLLFEKELAKIVEGKIVLLGYFGQDEWDESIKDKFFTPLNDKVGLKATPDMFGVAIHANVISMVLDNCFILEPSSKVMLAINIFWITALILLFRYIWSRVNTGYYKLVRLVQVGLLLTWFFVIGALFYFFHININTMVPVIVMVLGWDIVKFYENVVVGDQKFLKS